MPSTLCQSGATSSRDPRAAYDATYFARNYPASRFHAAGDKPVVNWAISRMLRRLCSRNRLGGGRPAVVHFGCGQGFLARACRHWSRNVGCDIAVFAAGSARANGVASVCAAFEVGCFRAGVFDAATAIDVLEHLDDPQAGLRTMCEALRPGGVALVTVPNLRSLSRRLKGRQWSAYRDGTHRSLVEPEKWREWFSAAGFEVLRVGTDALWDPPYFCRRLGSVERLAILAASNLAMLAGPQWPWPLGDNLVAALRKPAREGE
ncbi:MAG: class I SAM-dependent methyltransferase [Bryobacteraceae bacterium]